MTIKVQYCVALAVLFALGVAASWRANVIFAGNLAFADLPRLETVVQRAGAKIVAGARPAKGTMIGLRLAEFPGCNLPVLLKPTAFGTNVLAVFATSPELARGNYSPFYAYLEKAGPFPHIMQLQLARLKESVLEFFGLSPFHVTAMALVIFIPNECSIIQSVPWSDIWRSKP